MEKYYRHGDLLIERISDVYLTEVNSTPKLSGNVLAEGETTGHMHRLIGDVQLYGKNEVEYFELKSDATLVHEEHDTIHIPKGMFKVVYEREYSPIEEATRRVVD